MPEIIQVIVVIVVAAVSFVLGHLFGWQRGTADTERRWREAVARADAQRRCTYCGAEPSK